MSDSTPPLPNDPAARTPMGEILDATTGQPPLGSPSTTTPTTTSEPSTNEPRDPTPPAAPKPDAPAVPEKYEFKDPSGKELASPLLDTVAPIFRELGLDQAAADKLVAAYYKHAQTEAEATLEAIKTTGKMWMDQTMADPELGPNMDKIKVDVGRALETTLSPPEREAFQKAMNDTMAGNNPAFVRAFWKLAQKVGPGTHITGNGPAPTGQNPRGTADDRPSVAEAMWPKLARNAS